jgi:hypothetical protein
MSVPLTRKKWDLGEFDQKGAVATRWGTKDNLLRLAAAAKHAGIDLVLDAVLNVSVLRVVRRPRLDCFSL